MRPSATKDWIVKVTNITKGEPFKFSDLPDELRTKSPLYNAHHRGYVEVVDKVLDKSGGHLCNLWQVVEGCV